VAKCLKEVIVLVVRSDEGVLRVEDHFCLLLEVKTDPGENRQQGHARLLVRRTFLVLRLELRAPIWKDFANDQAILVNHDADLGR